MNEPRTITLESLADGAAEELFADALRRVLENIADPNTDWKKERKIVLTIGLNANDDDRRNGNVSVSCKTTLVGVKDVSTQVYYGKHEGILGAVEAPRQIDMFPNPVGRPKAVEAAGGEE